MPRGCSASQSNNRQFYCSSVVRLHTGNPAARQCSDTSTFRHFGAWAAGAGCGKPARGPRFACGSDCAVTVRRSMIPWSRGGGVPCAVAGLPSDVRRIRCRRVGLPLFWRLSFRPVLTGIGGRSAAERCREAPRGRKIGRRAEIPRRAASHFREKVINLHALLPAGQTVRPRTAGQTPIQ